MNAAGAKKDLAQKALEEARVRQKECPGAAAKAKAEEDASRKAAEELEEEAILLHYGFFLMTLMLTIGFIGGYMLEKKHFTYIHEAGGHLLPTGR